MDDSARVSRLSSFVLPVASILRERHVSRCESASEGKERPFFAGISAAFLISTPQGKTQYEKYSRSPAR